MPYLPDVHVHNLIKSSFQYNKKKRTTKKRNYEITSIRMYLI
jgi:hypothetical protein